jgi:hypothetical protein
MPSRHTYWVIVSGAHATAFRAREREDLMPTLRQLQRTQPNTSLRWFERGRLWQSPAEARDALRARRVSGPPSRGRDWRPGGNHADPRAKYKQTRDQKRERYKKRMIRSGGSNPVGRKTYKKKDGE